MKVLLIGHEDGLNGASKSLLNIIDELILRMNQVIVLTSYSSGPFYDELSKRNVKIIVEPYDRWCVYKCSNRRIIKPYVVNMLQWMRLKAINTKTAKKVASIAINEGVRIIHSNTSVINIGGLISKYSGIRHIWHIREFADLDFNMYPLIPKPFFFSFMNHNADRFICISNAVSTHFSELYAEKKTVVYNGIDKSFFLDISKRERNNTKLVRILLAGRISVAKGQQEAIDACNYLWKKGIRNFSLILAGNQGMALRVPPNLIGYIFELGEVTNMPELRKTIDLELVCSKAEAFGRVTAEAMMGGIPVIGSNTGGTPELIIDGKTGFLYEKGDIKQLAERILFLIENPGVRQNMGEAAQEYAMKHFTIERCVDEIEQVYREVLEQSSAASC